MPAPEICLADFDALLRRVADLEVAAKRRLDDAVNADTRLSETPNAWIVSPSLCAA